MILRTWHGWTTKENAPVYGEILEKEVFPSIENKKVDGLRKITLLKTDGGHDVEFMTHMLFDDLASVKAFAGEDYEKSYVIDRAKAVLLRYDKTARHFEVVSERGYP